MKPKTPIIEFLVITFGLSSVCYYLWITGGEAAAGISALLMWCPAVAAFVVSRRHFKNEKVLGWNKCRISFVLAALLAPVIYLGLSYGIYWMVNPEAFTEMESLTMVAPSFLAGTSPIVTIVVTLILAFPGSVLTAAGEEIGWRGFLLPQLAKAWGVKAAVLGSGLIWAVWHMPIMLAGLYVQGTPPWYQVPMFVLTALVVSVVMGVLTLKSNSVWPAILLHASHNFVDQIIVAPLTNSANSAYFVGETGVITLAAAVLVAAGIVRLFWKNVSNQAMKTNQLAG